MTGTASERPRYRILVGLVETSGVLNRLANGLRQNGEAADFIELSKNRFNFKNDTQQPWPAATCVSLQARFEKSSGIKRYFFFIARFFLKLYFFLQCIVRYDVFIFGSFSFFFRGLDLPILRMFGRKVIVICMGSEHRPAYLNAVHVLSPDIGFESLAHRAAKQAADVQFIERYANYFIASPLSAHFHKTNFVNFFTIGIPLEPEALKTTPTVMEPRRSGAFRILHAPSRIDAKGTPLIRALIAKLQDSGEEIEYTEISGRPHAEVLTALNACDLVVDEVYSDALLAGLGTEAASLGKPTLLGGYENASLFGQLPEELIPPMIISHPGALEDALRYALRNPGSCAEIGRAAKLYVIEQMSARSVAARLLKVIQGNIPADWFVDPADLKGVHGYGLGHERLRSTIRGIIDACGTGGLHLSHNPNLQAALLESASAAEATTPTPGWRVIGSCGQNDILN